MAILCRHGDSSRFLSALGGSAALHGLLALGLGALALTHPAAPPRMMSVEFIPLMASAPVPALAPLEPVMLARQPPESVPPPEAAKTEPPPTESRMEIAPDRAQPRPPRKKPRPAQEKSAAPAALSPPVAERAAPHDAALSVATPPIHDAAYLRNPAPDYPALAKRRGMEGQVMLEVKVTADGMAEDVRIADSSGFTLLDEAARAAVSRWQFVPAQADGRAVAAKILVPVAFRLR